MPARRSWRFEINVRRALRRAKAQLRGRSDPELDTRHAMVGPPKFWREKREFQITFLMGRGLLPSHSLLDIGCGTLRGGIPLIDYLDAGHYTGTDVREEVLTEARRELARNELEDKRPTLLVSDDLATLHLGTTFDYVWAFSVFIHMTDPILRSCVAFASEHLSGSGVFFANARVGERKDKEGHWGFPVVSRPFDFYESNAREAGLSVTDMGTLDSLGHKLGLSGDLHHMLRFVRA